MKDYREAERDEKKEKGDTAVSGEIGKGYKNKRQKWDQQDHRVTSS